MSTAVAMLSIIWEGPAMDVFGVLVKRGSGELFSLRSREAPESRGFLSYSPYVYSHDFSVY